MSFPRVWPNRILENLLFSGRSPSIRGLEFVIKMILYCFFEYGWLLHGERRIIHPWNVLGWLKVMQVFGQRSKFGLCLFQSVLLALDGLGSSKLFKFLSELLVFLLEGLKLLLPQVKVVDIFADKEAPENFLYHDGLLGEVSIVFVILVLHLLDFEHLPRVENSKHSLNFDGGGFLFQKLFSFGMHAKFGLNL